MRPLILSRVLGACALLTGVALAQNAGGTGGSSQTLPVGQTFLQFTFPVYGPDGQLKYTLFADKATGMTLNRAETTNLKIDVFDNGAKTTTITSPKADLYVAEQKMRTKNTVLIERADMEAKSQDCDFDVKGKTFILRTKVHVLLKHFDVGTGNSGKPKPGAVSTTPPAAEPPSTAPALPADATPAPMKSPSAPMPTDDSILPSPGAFSDTNAAPLPPSSSTTK